jgi:IclR family transcriptional regulator, acetate operon repressor
MITETTDDDRLVGTDRVLAVLVELGAHPRGISLDELAARVSSPKPTVHRALASLRRAGLATQTGRGMYLLGDEFLRIAFANAAERPDAEIVAPLLQRLTERYGETSHYAVLDGDAVVYRAKVDPVGGAVRLTSVVGGRNPAFCTAVGKLLLSQRTGSLDELRAIVGTGPFPRRAPNTLTSVEELWRDLEVTRERGYAVDDQENETGVNCLAVPFRVAASGAVTGAVSVSAVAFRTPLAQLVAEAPTIAAIAGGG